MSYQANCSFRAYKNTELRAHHTCKKTGRLDFSLREHVGELKAWRNNNASTKHEFKVKCEGY
jgi:hypothetical protein